ncbi:glycosyltransferase family 2 protein [Paenibacillus planticolens]|uniref:Glycosyltransferase n=1 Tax=Paenibacillus planticolens TaxID=2654976 RepID=A0ABX1ZJL0_9BACL|nr:glycosyltransferase family 2 protein [Paenibacillus planticolens]NOV00011.1 glycosyltransferase [Paenibacillus planticolens]
MISVIICTYNRSEILRECIESVLKNQVENDFELLVIDNNSNDNTEEIVSLFTNNYSNVRYVKEEQVGLSIARNTGIAEATGEIVAFIDDDVVVSPLYIQAIHSFFCEHPEEVCAGGKVIPVWEFEKPEWFVKNFASIIGETTYGEKKRILKFQEVPIGCNMIFKKEIFRKTGMFNINLGIKGDELFLGEENALCEKIRKLGRNIYYLPEAYVRHKVHRNKVSQDYVLRRLKLEGASMAQWHMETKKKTDVLLQYTLRFMMLWCKDIPLLLLRRNSFALQCKVSRKREYLKQIRKLMKFQEKPQNLELKK